MGLIFKLIILSISIYVIYSLIKKKFFKSEELENKEKKENATSMIECNCCNLYITKEDSIKSQNLYFCSEECIKKKYKEER